MSKNFEASLNINPVTPEQALKRSVEVGLLDSSNIERLNGNYTSFESSSQSIILPALRVLGDFEIGEEVWLYDSDSRPSFFCTTIISKRENLNMLVLTEHKQTSASLPPNCKLVMPHYYGLWHPGDLKIISEFNSSHLGKRRVGPSFLIELANALAEQASGVIPTNVETARSVTRKLNAL